MNTQTKKEIYGHWTQRPDADEIREKISEKRRGQKPWNKGKTGVQSNPLKGKKMPKKWAEKARISRIGKMKAWNKGKIADKDNRVLSGDKHYAWKGDNVGNKSLHNWIRRKLGTPMICQLCDKEVEKTIQIHWANISHTYKRDLNDWIRLCVPCHKNYDLGNIQL